MLITAFSSRSWDKDSAKEVLDSVGVSAGVKVADLIKGIALALFTLNDILRISYALARTTPTIENSP